MTEEQFIISCPNLYLEESKKPGESTFRYVHSHKSAWERWNKLIAETKAWEDSRRRAYLDNSGIGRELAESSQLARLGFYKGRLVEIIRFFAHFSGGYDASASSDRREAIKFVESFLGLVEQGGEKPSDSAIRTKRLRDEVGESLRLDIEPRPGYWVTITVNESLQGKLGSMSIEELFVAPQDILQQIISAQ